MRGRKILDGDFERDGYDSLAIAIVLTAASDYVLCREWMELHPITDHDTYRVKMGRVYKEERLRDVQKFFKSGWYRALTRVDSNYLVKKLEDRIQEDLNKWELNNI